MRATRGRGRGGSSAAAGHTRRDRASRSAPQAGVEEAATEEEQEQDPVAEVVAAPGMLPALGKKEPEDRSSRACTARRWRAASTAKT